ncbi:MAG TPA: M36 family metallopeptidase, partial [Myxococcota bacterium]|nr:M36 family metallopeptidase [Myxococcota bacterium]
IAGTFALAQVQGGALRYAHAYLVTPPRVAAVPQLSASAAARAALEDARAFAVAASESLQPVQEVVFYVGDAAHLAWQVDLRTEGPDATWQIFVDARSGAVLGRHKTSMTAVSGTVYGNIEPACQGDAPQRVALPHLTWAPGSFTDAEGHFSSDGDVRKARVNMHGRYFKLRTLSLRPKKWEVPLAAVPADNEVVLEDAPLGLVDPYVHAHTARDWARGRLGALSGTAAERTLAWTEAPVQVIVNFGLMRCNAAYMPIMGGLLAFFPGQKGTCNNAGQVAKVVYHEYGHGVHHHLSGMQQFDLQISEGAGDYVASTITNNPDMTGLISCKEPLPTGNKRMQRTCANHYTYCKERGTCDTFAGEEAHTTAPVVCGAFWDLRESLIARYGANEGVRQADTLFLKFLSLSTNLDGIYSAAIAADEDDDGDPKNGTKHSCEINAAFLGEGAGLTAHFPDAKLDRVP